MNESDLVASMKQCLRESGMPDYLIEERHDVIVKLSKDLAARYKHDVFWLSLRLPSHLLSTPARSR